jgi:hypothetical protein
MENINSKPKPLARSRNLMSRNAFWHEPQEGGIKELGRELPEKKEKKKGAVLYIAPCASNSGDPS